MKPKTKFSHRKKRNTAFLYETLTKELTIAILNKDFNKKNNILKILKEFFSKDKILYRELEVYNCLCNSKELESNIAEKILTEAKKEYNKLPQDKIFTEQSKLLNSINKSVGTNVYSNFVPNYKNLASVFQIFSDNLKIKDRVLLEKEIIDLMCSSKEKIESKYLKPIDSIVVNSFVKKFNEKYDESLIKEQKQLLNKFISSFENSNLEFKYYLNEEIERLKINLKNILNLNVIKENKILLEKTQKLEDKLKEFSQNEINKKMIIELMKIQGFIFEATSDGN